MFHEMCTGSSFEATVEMPRVPGAPARTYRHCRMVKIHDIQTNEDVALIIDERPRGAWIAGASVDAMITMNSQMVHILYISQEKRVRAHIDPISLENVCFLEALLSSATIRVIYNQARKLAILDLSKHKSMHTLTQCQYDD
jgi:hypothetical protein